jgi:hypothetical protein
MSNIDLSTPKFTMIMPRSNNTSHISDKLVMTNKYFIFEDLKNYIENLDQETITTNYDEIVSHIEKSKEQKVFTGIMIVIKEYYSRDIPENILYFIYYSFFNNFAFSFADVFKYYLSTIDDELNITLKDEKKFLIIKKTHEYIIQTYNEYNRLARSYNIKNNIKVLEINIKYPTLKNILYLVSPIISIEKIYNRFIKEHLRNISKLSSDYLLDDRKIDSAIRDNKFIDLTNEIDSLNNLVN